MAKSKHPGVISFDCDGVLLDTSWFATGWLGEEFPGLSISEGDISCWEFSQAFGLSRDMYKRFWKDFYSFELPPILPAVDVVHELRDRGYHVVVVTARKGEELPSAVRVLTDSVSNTFGFTPDDIFSCSAGEKAAFLDGLNVIAHVDDKWSTASDLAEIWQGSGKVSYLFSRPWNKSLDIATQYKRINNYMEVLNDFQ